MAEPGRPNRESSLRAEIAAALAAMPPLAELSRREAVIDISARHAARVLEANEVMNLTTITEPREVAVKHVADSLAPWRLLETSKSVLDLGSGAGYPGVPLAALFPEKTFLLAESTRKKARFLEETVEELRLDNAAVAAQRGEIVLGDEEVDAVIARAAGRAAKVLELLAPVRGSFRRLLLYKGPAAEEELREAERDARRLGLRGRMALVYELPGRLGRRAVLEYR
jgi:16S rRNA (guanine527-N7)-methyltransferase